MTPTDKLNIENYTAIETDLLHDIVAFLKKKGPFNEVLDLLTQLENRTKKLVITSIPEEQPAPEAAVNQPSIEPVQTELALVPPLPPETNS